MIYSVGITGHRPSGLVLGGRPLDIRAEVESLLQRAISRAVAEGADRVRFNTGGALGVDQMVAEAARSSEPRQIPVEYALYLPFPPHVIAARWTAVDRARLEQLIATAASVDIVADTYTTGAYYTRNHRIVDNSDVIVAFWTGATKGGTYECVRYALLNAPRHPPVFNALDGFAAITPAAVSTSRTRRSNATTPRLRDGT